MNNTSNARDIILQGLRKKRMTKTEFCKKLGFKGRSWSTKLFNGTLKSISEDLAFKIQDLLDIEFVPFHHNDPVPLVARQIGEAMEERPEIKEILTSILSLVSDGQQVNDGLVRLHVDVTKEDYSELQASAQKKGVEVKDILTDRISILDNVIDMQPFELPILGSSAAGVGDYSDFEESVQVDKEYPPHYFGTRVNGISMDDNSPQSIPNGSIAVLNPKWQGAPYAAKGKVYAWSIDEGVVIKKFSRKNGGELVSLSPAFPPIPYTESMKPFGEFVELV